MLKALVIGCGSIGAAYDLHNDEVQTHTKAFSLHPEIEFEVADIDRAKAEKVAVKYSVPVFDQLDNDDALANFDIVSLCVITQFHFGYLERLLRSPRPFIICEKPVMATLKEATALQRFPTAGERILVNYIRRFQPGFALLKERLQKLLRDEHECVRHVEIRYQRGFLNNCSHALDLLSFLLNVPPTISHVQVSRAIFDAFPSDPTATLQCSFGGVPAIVVGFEDPSFIVFEIDIYTTNMRITISDSGNTIRYFRRDWVSNRLMEQASRTQTEVLKNYMVPVVDTALACLRGEKPTNFASSLSLNEAILKTISEISKDYGQTGN